MPLSIDQAIHHLKDAILAELKPTTPVDEKKFAELAVVGLDLLRIFLDDIHSIADQARKSN